MAVEEVIVENIEKKYRYFQLKIGRLVFSKGVNMVVGPNGSGKSTLLKIIAGFVYPDKGRVLVKRNGLVEETQSLYKYAGYVGEDIRFPNLRVKTILNLFSEEESRVSEVTRILKLKEHLDKKYYALSSGYRKRVQIAVALLKNSEILILDEPFANLDVFMVKPLKEVLEEIGKTRIVILTSHIGLEVTVASLTVLDQGRLVYHGRPGPLEPVFKTRIGELEALIPLKILNKLIAPLEILEVERKGILDILEKYTMTRHEQNIASP